MNEHEAGFLEFIAQPQRQRIGTLLELGPKRRKEVQAMLHHAIRLDDRYARPLTGGEQLPETIAALLRARGAPQSAYLISSSSELDGREMMLDTALAAVAGSGHGAFISCRPGKLGYFESEDVNSGHLLQR